MSSRSGRAYCFPDKESSNAFLKPFFDKDHSIKCIVITESMHLSCQDLDIWTNHRKMMVLLKKEPALHTHKHKNCVSRYKFS